MSSNKPVKAVKRKSPAENRSAIPSMATRKRSSCSGVGLAIFFLIIILIVLLIASGVISSPFTEPEPTATIPVVQETTASAEFSTTEPSGLPTDTQTPVPSLTPTSLPTETPTPPPTNTPTSTPTATATVTPTEKPMPYVIRGTPQALPNSVFHPEYACEQYIFIGGQVWDMQEAPVRGLVIRLGGFYGGELVDFTTKSGSALLYGESGYEFVLKNKLVNEQELFIQLESVDGEKLSAQTYLVITDDCAENLIIVNFKQVR